MVKEKHMKTKLIVLIFVAIAIVALSACGNPGGTAAPSQTAVASAATSGAAPASEAAPKTAAASAAALADGIYSADFTTDSSMFHVNEANGGKGVLTVKDGKMTIHVSLASKNIVNLFAGTAEDAKKDGAALLKPTTDSVNYSDGKTEEVYGFDIPVPAVGEKFAVALVGTKGTWYDHAVSVSNPVPDK
jgi:hypothetical protein